MAEELLIKQNGEFYPFGAKIDNQGNLTHVAHYDGDDFPLSAEKIKELGKYFDQEIRGESIRAYAITFDCLAKRDSSSEKTEAIGIECYSNENSQRITYYYPYEQVTTETLDFGEPWGVIAD